MRLFWKDEDRAAWDALHRERLGAWQQDWAFADAMAAIGGRAVRLRIEDEGRTLGLALFTFRRFAGVFTAALCTRGPVWAAGAGPELRREAMRRVKRGAPFGRPRFIIVSPEAPDRPAELAGWTRLMTGHSTAMIDLGLPLDTLKAGLAGKWRNRLAAAQRGGVVVEPMGAKPAQYQWLIEREAAQRRARGYVGLPPAMVAAFQAAKPDRREAVCAFRARIGREDEAGMLFLRHGDAATYHIGWTSERGRAAGAHNALMWRAIETLKAAGVKRLDLGGVDTAEGAGIARFKLGAGGEVVTLAGAFV